MASSTFAPHYHPAQHPLLIIERFLRDRDSVWQQIDREERLSELIRQMLMSSAIALASYGAVLGFAQGLWQALASAIKLPLLFLLTLAVCLPTLYVYNLLCGGRVSPRQALALVLAAITITATFTLAFAPITLFFLITGQSYHFFILLNVAILGLTGSVGLSFLLNGARQLNALAQANQTPTLEDERNHQRPQINLLLLGIWLGLYAFVGAQLGWALRPFFGIPGEPFVLFRTIGGDFYTSIITMIQWSLR